MPRVLPPAVEIPHLEGWETLADASLRLGLSRQRMFVMIREKNDRGKPKLAARKVGHVKPVYIVRKKDIDKMLQARSAG